MAKCIQGKTLEEMKREMDEDKNFVEPVRGNMDDPDIKWRQGKPDYTAANYAFYKSKSKFHGKGTLKYLIYLYT